MIEGKLSYRQHIQYMCDKASTASITLAKMIPNVGRPGYTSRLLIARVMSLIILYATPVWEETLQLSVNTNKSVVYRKTVLKLYSALGAISDDEAFVTLGMMPIDIILVDEMTNIHIAKPISPLSETKNAVRERSMI